MPYDENTQQFSANSSSSSTPHSSLRSRVGLVIEARETAAAMTVRGQRGCLANIRRHRARGGSPVIVQRICHGSNPL